MNTYSELVTELAARLLVADNSTLYPTARLQQLIIDANKFATNLFDWPELERAIKTHTSSSNEFAYSYYDYPDLFRTDTIHRTYVDGQLHDKKAFEDFLDYVDKNPNETKKYIFADYGRQIFFFPMHTTNGNKNIHLYGQIQDNDFPTGRTTTIFSTFDTQGNEAILEKALAVALVRSNPQESKQLEASAVSRLSLIFKRRKQAQQRDQRLDHPFFEVPDFFEMNGQSRVGNFTIFNRS